jgi:hypothetical protein
LDALQQELAGAQSREMILTRRQGEQETQIAALQGELCSAEGKIQELDAARSRLAEMERAHQALRDENRRLNEELSRSAEMQRLNLELRDENRRLGEELSRSAEMQRLHQTLRDENQSFEAELSRSAERLDGSEQNPSQVHALSQQLDESQTKQEPLLDLNDEIWRLSPSNGDLNYILRSATDAGGELARDPIAAPAANSVEHVPSPMALPPIETSIHGSGDTRDHQTPSRSDGAAAATTAESGTATAATVQSRRRKKSRMAKISALVVLSITAGGGLGFLGIRYLAAKDASVTREFAPDERWTPSEADSPTAETKPAPRLQGRFKITRETEVYSRPTEQSALITRIEPGIKINVVDSRDGWLEIRSKHGRPPGFVREEAAVKMDRN